MYLLILEESKVSIISLKNTHEDLKRKFYIYTYTYLLFEAKACVTDCILLKIFPQNNLD